MLVLNLSLTCILCTWTHTCMHARTHTRTHAHTHARTHTHRQHAVTYYNQAASHEKLGDYYYVMEEYSRLEQLADDLPDIHCLR